MEIYIEVTLRFITDVIQIRKTGDIIELGVWNLHFAVRGRNFGCQ